MKPNKIQRRTAISYTFTTDSLAAKLNNIIGQNRFHFTNGKHVSARSLLQFLYKIDFITAKKTLEDGSVDRKYFDGSRFLAHEIADFGYGWEITPPIAGLYNRKMFKAFWQPLIVEDVCLLPLWSQLRTLGLSLPGRIAILAPFLGYILISREALSGLLSSASPAVGDAFTSISVLNIYFTYFGLCLFGTGTLIFQCFCSSLIKRFDSEDHYVASILDGVTSIEITRYLSDALESPILSADDKRSASLFLNSVSAGMSKVPTDAKIFALRKHYLLQDRSMFVLRVTSFAFMLSGLLMLALPTVSTFYHVVEQVL